MLTQEENELLTRVGPGTPMGALFRRHWFPALLSSELPEPDCPPVRVKLLSEDLVAFRDTNGRVGLLAENCSHRRASLFYGRNEECGLRCIYHGWKYDVEGNILDTPAEPAESMIKHHVKHTAYPTFEKNGVIQTYMGPREKMPLVPNYEWWTLPAEQVTVGDKYLNECNWLQSVEGDCDSAHLYFLHRRGEGIEVEEGLQAPVFELDDDYMSRWVTAAAIRRVGPGLKYVRQNTFVPPSIGLPPVGRSIGGILDGFFAVYQVPADDYNTWRINVTVRRSGPIARGGSLYDDEPSASRFGGAGYTMSHKEVGADWRKIANRSNDYMIDREKQMTSIYSGIPWGNHVQDACVTETMGPISDRTQEHLGLGDAQPVAIRQFLLKSLRDMKRGIDPPGVVYDQAHNDFTDLYVINGTVPEEVPWRSRKEISERLIAAPYR